MTQATTATTPPHHQEGCGRLREECATLVSMRLRAPGSRGRPPDPLLCLHYAQTRVAPSHILALENVIRKQPTQIS
jgi:hypothetical protein